MTDTAPSTETRSTEEVRKQIRADLPEDTFAMQPQRALWFIPLALVGFGSIATIIVATPPWYLCLLLALVAGQCMAAMGFLAHEVLHGSVVKSKGLQTFLGYLGFAPMLVSPTLWRTWHNQVHHGRTNQGNSDPDAFGTVSRYEKAPSTRFVARLAPGSRHPMSYLFFAYWFMFHGQVVLWIQSRYMRGFRRMNRRRAIADSAVSALLWATVAVLALLAGPMYVLFAVVIPLVLANFIVMSYIATNHFMRPLTRTNDPIENSMSVNTLPVIDRLHFNFSHHVEHHLFPNMSAKHAPRVRAWLKANEGERYVSPAHWMAFLYLYKTPRVYLDSTTLVDPDDPQGPYRADTRELAELLH
jgi:fatty acid desaturase